MPLLLLLLGLFGFQRPPTPPAPPPPAAASSLDYEFFKTRVQPIFLAKRPGHARCITCHETGQPRLATLEDGATSFTEEQSRQNFAAWQRVVVPGDPDASRLLTHPLAKSAGGDPFHAGGRHWQSKSDPEFQTLVAWVKTGASPTAAQSTCERRPELRCLPHDDRADLPEGACRRRRRRACAPPVIRVSRRACGCSRWPRARRRGRRRSRGRTSKPSNVSSSRAIRRRARWRCIRWRRPQAATRSTPAASSGRPRTTPSTRPSSRG